MRLFICLSLLCGAVAAQEPEPPLFGSLQTGAAVRLSHGYQFPLTLNLNSAEAPADFVAWIEFHTASGQRIPCHAIEHADLLLHTELEPQTLSQQILCPAVWYRGQGTLSVAIQACSMNHDGQRQCPDYDSAAQDMIRLDTNMILP